MKKKVRKPIKLKLQVPKKLKSDITTIYGTLTQCSFIFATSEPELMVGRLYDDKHRVVSAKYIAYRGKVRLRLEPTVTATAMGVHNIYYSLLPNIRDAIVNSLSARCHEPFSVSVQDFLLRCKKKIGAKELGRLVHQAIDEALKRAQ